MPDQVISVSQEKWQALERLAEAVTEAVYGCEDEISGERLRSLAEALTEAEAAGLTFPDAQERGRRKP